MKTFTLLFITLCIVSKIFSQAGTLDSTFSHDGKVFTGFNDGPTGATCVAIQTDGKIVAGGTLSDVNSYLSTEFVLVRYMPDGKIDHHFGIDGKVLTHIKTRDRCYGIVIQTDGKILAVGTSDQTYDYQSYKTYMTLVRYKTNGELDSSFGKKGIVSTRFETDTYGAAVAIQQNNKIIVAGGNYRPGKNNYAIFLARFDNDGKTDSSFGDNGVVITSSSKNGLSANAIAIQPGDKIVVGGSAGVGQGSNFLAARYTKDGKLDSSFGDNGMTTASFGKYDNVSSLALQPDHKIVLIGTANYNGLAHSDIALVRFTKNGLPDSSFTPNHDGKLLIHTGSYPYGNFVVVQPDGKIVAAGTTDNGYYGEFFLSRYYTNGTIDKTFGSGGSVSTKIGGYYGASLSSIALQPDGKIVAIGSSSGEFAVVRYKGDSTSSLLADNNIVQQIQNATLNKPISVYLSPNPVKNVLNIQGLSSSTNTISIIDNTGKTLQAVITSNKTYLLNVQHLAAGIYFIKVDDGQQTTTLKFIKE